MARFSAARAAVGLLALAALAASPAAAAPSCGVNVTEYSVPAGSSATIISVSATNTLAATNGVYFWIANVASSPMVLTSATFQFLAYNAGAATGTNGQGVQLFWTKPSTTSGTAVASYPTIANQPLWLTTGSPIVVNVTNPTGSYINGIFQLGLTIPPFNNVKFWVVGQGQARVVRYASNANNNAALTDSRLFAGNVTVSDGALTIYTGYSVTATPTANASTYFGAFNNTVNNAITQPVNGKSGYGVGLPWGRIPAVTFTYQTVCSPPPPSPRWPRRDRCRPSPPRQGR